MNVLTLYELIKLKNNFYFFILNNFEGGESIGKLNKTLITEEIPFEVNIPILKQSGGSSPDEPMTFEGLARTTDKSLSRHLTTEECIQDMKNQIIEAVKQNQPIPSFINHNPDEICGNIIGVKESPPIELWPITQLLTESGNMIADAPMAKVQNWIKNNVRLGMSISGIMQKAKFVEDYDNEDWWIEIDKISLKENSITPIPAQEETEGTLSVAQSCSGLMCNQIVKQAMPTLKEKYPLISEAVQRIKDLKQSPSCPCGEPCDNPTGEYDEEACKKKKESLKVNNMVDIDETKFKKMEQGIDYLLNKEMEREKLEEAAKAQKAQDDLIKSKVDEAIKELKQEYATREEDIKKEMMKTMAESFIGKNLGQVAQPSAVGTPTPAVEEPVVQSLPVNTPAAQIDPLIVGTLQQTSKIEPGQALTEEEIGKRLRQSAGRPAVDFMTNKIIQPFYPSNLPSN